MQYLNIPKFPTLRGEDAIKALNDYVQELVEQKPEELTDKQVTTLTKFAEGLISSIQSQTPSKSLKPRPSLLSRIGLSSKISSVLGASSR
jgi:phage host-nuclease inhibitor protein Gam